MSIYTFAYIECDNCHAVEGQDENLFSENQAQHYADTHGWATIGDNHYCPSCKDLDEVVRLAEGY